ncbi:acetyl-CoA carboxylase biotin carboxyl carrier protein [Arthrobacter sp. TS-15]|uniref:acetyl-CoA carboxylase biotin carboxyl carrier protein n=1 Tax=Arthrobacter sp. TS-15 TaxID=2510797 RepID=UPI00115CA0D5|nr:biotin/lipoyl-containing protein [Arthrobacter sp. TS-15]TQS88582.1 acetyl-CoA carboxylase biotin carboxyl carrier protein [Arthrobacter sp. TS-15]
MSTPSTPSWQDVLDLVTRLDDAAYDSAAVEFGDVSVRLSRSADLPVTSPTAGTTPQSLAPSPNGNAPATAPAAAPAVTEPAAAKLAPSAPAPAEPASNSTVVTAPIIGVFYRSPSPGAPPFVEPGAAVEADTTIGIIEVMKLMNPVTAGTSGTLTEFLAADNAQVEFGQPLAVVAGEESP